MMKTKQEIINQYKNLYAILEYENKLYFTLSDRSENVYNADGSILGKAYQPQVGKILALGKIVYQSFDKEPLIEEDQ